MLQTALNTATLYLYEPPLIDSLILDKLSAAFNSLSLGGPQPSVLDTLYRSSTALRLWFDHWLTIPVETYQWLPVTFCCQIIYSTGMLTRWARLAGPFNPPNVSDQRVQPPPNADKTVAAQGPCLGVTGQVQDRVASPLAMVQIRDSADPRIPAAIAALRQQLHAQADLNVDILGILGALGTRFEHVSRDLLAASIAAGGTITSNIWDLSAKKVLLTRAKLERWSEIIVTGGVEAAQKPRAGEPDEGDDDGEHDADCETDESNQSSGFAEADMTGCVLGNGDVWMMDGLWDNDNFTVMESNMWYDNGSEWSTGL
jgi:hypothetical protein